MISGSMSIDWHLSSRKSRSVCDPMLLLMISYKACVSQLTYGSLPLVLQTRRLMKRSKVQKVPKKSATAAPDAPADTAVPSMTQAEGLPLGQRLYFNMVGYSSCCNHRQRFAPEYNYRGCACMYRASPSQRPHYACCSLRGSSAIERQEVHGACLRPPLLPSVS